MCLSAAAACGPPNGLPRKASSVPNVPTTQPKPRNRVITHTHTVRRPRACGPTSSTSARGAEYGLALSMRSDLAGERQPFGLRVPVVRRHALGVAQHAAQRVFGFGAAAQAAQQSGIAPAAFLAGVDVGQQAELGE